MSDQKHPLTRDELFPRIAAVIATRNGITKEAVSNETLLSEDEVEYVVAAILGGGWLLGRGWVIYWNPGYTVGEMLNQLYPG